MEETTVKKGKISDFQKRCRLYFSSISSRACKYLYLNLPGRENALVLSNADPDSLLTLSSTFMTAIHYVLPKDDFMSMFKQYFFTDGSDNDTYIIKTDFITKSFKDYRVESVLSHIDPVTKDLKILGGGSEITVTTDKEDDEDEIETERDWNIAGELDALLEDNGWDTEVKRAVFKNTSTAGIPLSDPHVLNILDSIVESTINDAEKAKTTDVIKFDHVSFINQMKVHANWYRSLSFCGNDFKLSDSGPFKEQRLLLIDGLDVPSVTEFLKKRYVKDEFVGDFKLYIYPCEDSVKSLSCYDSDDVTIYSTRPFNSTLLVPDFTSQNQYRHIKNPQEVFREP